MLESTPNVEELKEMGKVGFIQYKETSYYHTSDMDPDEEAKETTEEKIITFDTVADFMKFGKVLGMVIGNTIITSYIRIN